MRLFMVGTILVISVVVLSFNLIFFGGFSYSSPTGWTFGLGASQPPFESDLFVTYIGSDTAFNVVANLPIFDGGFYKIGPSVIYMYGNYSGEWEGKGGVGIEAELPGNDYLLRGGLYYPINSEFSFSQHMYIEVRYILKPSGNRKFKDTLFFFLTYSHGFFRFGVGLSEPIP